MSRPHLTQDELDRLLDDEGTPETAALAAHVAECTDCRERLNDAKAFAGLIADLPRHAPSVQFAERVMASVPVITPWYVEVGDAMAEWLPRVGRSKWVAAGAAAAVTGALTLTVLLLASQSDLLLLAIDVGLARSREIAARALGDVVIASFGPQAVDAVTGGGPAGFALAAMTLVLGFTVTLLTLRAQAAAARARRG